ncbi:MAG: type II toxin-antitoxin system ParD family antitoxin [Polyangiaceae bacterium]
MSHVELPDEVLRLAEAQVTAGRAGSIEEVVRVGAAVLERRQQRHDAKLAAVRAAIEEGDASPDFAGDPFAAVRAEFGLTSR